MASEESHDCPMLEDCQSRRTNDADRRVKDAEWKGEVKSDLTHLKESNVGLWAKFDELSKGLNSLQIKIAGIVGGIIVLSEIIKHYWK